MFGNEIRILVEKSRVPKNTSIIFLLSVGEDAPLLFFVVIRERSAEEEEEEE